jgi:TRAP-type C4-dicarboxylate transport system substrate-binding protein
MNARRPLLLGALAAPALLAARGARAQEVTLRLHHFLPAVSNVHRHFLQPWAQKIGQESNGRLRVQIFPAMQLGGAPPQLYDQARDGVVDIVWTLPGNTPGRFPSIEVIELPFVAHKRASVNARVTQELFDTVFRNEFADTQILCAWAHDAGVIHARREVRRLEDMNGLRLRFPTRQAGEALRAVGAAPVGMPIPQVPEALAQGVIDGAVVPWEVVPAIRIHETLRNHTEFAGSPTFYTASFVLAMNRARYDALPGDLKAVLDANSGQAAATMAARVWDEQGPTVEQMVRRRGNAIVELDAAETQRWSRATQPVLDAWVRAMGERNLNGGALLERARALIAQHGQGVS